MSRRYAEISAHLGHPRTKSKEATFNYKHPAWVVLECRRLFETRLKRADVLSEMQKHVEISPVCVHGYLTYHTRTNLLPDSNILSYVPKSAI